MPYLPSQTRRAISLAIPLFTALLLFGIVTNIFGITIDENLFNTGVNLKHIFGVLNIISVIWIYKRRIS